MGTVAERWKIEAVLALVRRARFECFRVVGSGDPRNKTRAFMKAIGYREADVHRAVRDLEVADYSSGPCKTTKDGRVICGCLADTLKNTKYI